MDKKTDSDWPICICPACLEIMGSNIYSEYDEPVRAELCPCCSIRRTAIKIRSNIAHCSFKKIKNPYWSARRSCGCHRKSIIGCPECRPLNFRRDDGPYYKIKNPHFRIGRTPVTKKTGWICPKCDCVNAPGNDRCVKCSDWLVID